MSNLHLVITLCLGILFLRGALGCATSVTGATWKFIWGVDEEIPGVETVEICSELCQEDASCHGYTWKSNDIVGYCYKFKNLDGLHACEGCSSGTFSENLAGACAGSVDDVIDSGTTETAEDCKQFCHDTLGCSAYTWYNGSTPFAKSCFLYGSCEEQLPCYGCSTGIINCIEAPHCFQYRILDEESRSITNYDENSKSWFCDQEEHRYTSNRWEGDGYYRFMKPSGTVIPEYSPGEYQCGTHGSGWLNGQHPEEVGLEVEMEVCFQHSSSNSCTDTAKITVTKCPTDYYVYHLVDTPCQYRYCAANEN